MKKKKKMIIPTHGYSALITYHHHVQNIIVGLRDSFFLYIYACIINVQCFYNVHPAKPFVSVIHTLISDTLTHTHTHTHIYTHTLAKIHCVNTYMRV